MISAVLKTTILYFFLTFIVRIMGKRQIGQLQPGELVVTIMISELAVLPLEDENIELWKAIVPVVSLALLEIAVSFIALKSIKLRALLQGNSVTVIRNGQPDVKQMRKLRYSTDDLLEALRQKDVFNIEDVQYAVAETDGSLSVLLKPEKRNATVSDVGAKPDDSGFPRVIISDGRTLCAQIRKSVLTEKDVEKYLKTRKTDIKDVLIMTVDDRGNITLVIKK